MASVADLTEPWGGILIGPRPGPGVCRRCFNLTDGYSLCYACAHGGDRADLVTPISYSVAGEQLHHVLAAYKRSTAAWARPLAHQLAAILWRHLALHEPCLASKVGVPRFPLVTSVPSGRPDRDPPHPLPIILGELVGPTRSRHETLLRRTLATAAPHVFDPGRFTATRPLDGEPVLLIDDTWTTGASAQSAAGALRDAGSGPVATLVLGRFLHRAWGANDRRLRALDAPFDWEECAWCARPRSRAPTDPPPLEADAIRPRR